LRQELGELGTASAISETNGTERERPVRLNVKQAELSKEKEIHGVDGKYRIVISDKAPHETGISVKLTCFRVFHPSYETMEPS
jgi:hypothetical protein